MFVLLSLRYIQVFYDFVLLISVLQVLVCVRVEGLGVCFPGDVRVVS